jgi:hypothetical protein
MKYALLFVAVVSMQTGAVEKKEGKVLRSFDDLDAAGIGKGYVPQVEPPVPIPVMPKKHLGFVDAWRYDRCNDNATSAPTPLGVTQGLRLCREKFGQ